MRHWYSQGPDAIVVTSAEQKAADDRIRSRIASIQAAIMTREVGKIEIGPK